VSSQDLAPARPICPKRLVAAVPVAPRDKCERLLAEVDEIVCALTPPVFSGVSQWYENFRQITDEEVRELFDRMIPRVRTEGESRLPV
jgi:putative phosphoribosyl transferase